MRRGVLRYALAPWWLLQLATSAKSFIDNPLIGSRRLNALGLHRSRVLIADHMAALRRRRLARRIQDDDRLAFARDGFVVKRDFLPPEQFAALRGAVLGYAGSARETMQGQARTRRLAIDRAMLRAIPQLDALLRSRTWRGLTRYVASFDGEPLNYVQTIFACAEAGDADPQTTLHADTFHATMKAWFFLNDVADEDGPFCYVPGSNRRTAARISWEERKASNRDKLDFLSGRGSLRIATEELATLGLPPAVRFAVAANTLIIADTSGFHARGAAQRPSTRVEIWAYARRNPFLPWIASGPLALSGVAERRIGWMWWLRDRLEPLVGQPWRPIGQVTPLGRREPSGPLS